MYLHPQTSENIEMATLAELNELNPMTITTTQRTKVFYFRPANGWKRGENADYRNLEDNLIARVNAKLQYFDGVKVVRSHSRYFEYFIEAKFVNAFDEVSVDSTSNLRNGLTILCNIADEMGLNIVTIGE